MKEALFELKRIDYSIKSQQKRRNGGNFTTRDGNLTSIESKLTSREDTFTSREGILISKEWKQNSRDGNLTAREETPGKLSNNKSENSHPSAKVINTRKMSQKN